MVTKIVPCTECSGTGETIQETVCQACGGTGLQTIPEPARTSIPPVERPLPPDLPVPQRAGSRRATVLLVALTLVIVAGVLAYLTSQRSMRRQHEATTVNQAPAAVPEPAPAPPPPDTTSAGTAPRSTPSRPRPVQFQARHKHSLGRRCEGLASFTANEFIFESKQHSLRISRADVLRNDGPGFKARGGKAWHFEFSGKNEKEVRSLFEDWYRIRAR